MPARRTIGKYPSGQPSTDMDTRKPNPEHSCSQNGPRKGDTLPSRFKCQSCAVRMTALCSSVSEEAASELGRAFHRRRVPAGQIIYSSDQKARVFAIIVSGVVKLTNVKPDGRQQIVGLQFPSDFVGRPFAGASNFLAEAATDLDLCCFSGDVFSSLMRRYPEIEGSLLKRTLDSLDAAREWMFMLGRKSAVERVAYFLLMLAERAIQPSPEDSEPPQALFDTCTFELPLSRTEIADGLGLRLETVSRQFAYLKSRGVISTARNRVLLVHSMRELRKCAENSGE